MRAVYALFEEHGAADLLAAMALAGETSVYGADYLQALLAAPGPQAANPGPSPMPMALALPAQAEVDRLLSSYEALVQLDIATAEPVPAFLVGAAGETAR
jgi:hypothetical protein